MPHSILDRPYEWKIVELRFVADDEPWLELRLAKNGVTRRLRFRGVLDPTPLPTSWARGEDIGRAARSPAPEAGEDVTGRYILVAAGRVSI